MEGKIVRTIKTKTGKEVIIRFPRLNDLSEMCRYINELSAEKTFVRYQGEKISLKEEAKYLKETLKKMKKKRVLQLLAFYKDKLIGILGVEMQEKVEKHVGVLGISVAKEYRGEGIGTYLMQTGMDEAKKVLPDLQLLTLCAFANNQKALSIYQKFGFKEAGRIPKGILYKGKYTDHVYMYKEVK